MVGYRESKNCSYVVLKKTLVRKGQKSKGRFGSSNKWVTQEGSNQWRVIVSVCVCVCVGRLGKEIKLEWGLYYREFGESSYEEVLVVKMLSIG